MEPPSALKLSCFGLFYVRNRVKINDCFILKCNPLALLYIKRWLSFNTDDGTLILLQLPVLSGSLKATDYEKDKAAKENDKEKDKKPAKENEVIKI